MVTGLGNFPKRSSDSSIEPSPDIHIQPPVRGNEGCSVIVQSSPTSITRTGPPLTVNAIRPLFEPATPTTGPNDSARPRLSSARPLALPRAQPFGRHAKLQSSIGRSPAGANGVITTGSWSSRANSTLFLNPRTAGPEIT